MEREEVAVGAVGFLLIFVSVVWYYMLSALGFFKLLDYDLAMTIFILILVGFLVDSALVVQKITGHPRNVLLASMAGTALFVVLVMLDEFLAVAVLGRMLFGLSWPWATLLGLIVAVAVLVLMEYLEYTDVW